MKKVLFMLCCWGVCIHATSKDFYFKSVTPYGVYGFEQVFNEEFYKNHYLDKEFTYFPCKYARGINEYLGLSRENEGEKYVFTKFSSRDDGDSDMDLIIHYRPLNEKSVQKKKINVYKSAYSVLNLPFIDENMVEKDIKEAIGQAYSHPDAKNTYTIVDAKFEYFDKESEYKSIVYYIQDSSSDEIHRLSNMNITLKELPGVLFEKKVTMIFQSVENNTHPQQDTYVGRSYYESLLSMDYKDSLLSARLIPLETSFAIILKNLSNYTMKIIWDEAVFVDTEGTSDNIIHAGVKFKEKEKTQVPSTIIKGATLKDNISCKKNINWIESKTNFTWKFGIGFTNEYTPGHWSEQAMYPNSSTVVEPLFMQLMLPIQIKDEINEYIFSIKYSNQFSFPLTIEQE